MVLEETRLTSDDLLKYYTTHLRPILEYTQVTYHSMLTSAQAGELERGQAKALRIAFNDDRSYRSLLIESGIERLEE